MRRGNIRKTLGPDDQASLSGALPPLPSVDEVMKKDACHEAISAYGRKETVRAVRTVLGARRKGLYQYDEAICHANDVARDAVAHVVARSRPNLCRVFNLTGTILHTNLGRAVIAESAIAAAANAMRFPAALEFKLDAGARGDRDGVVRELITELTGADDAIVVNNNAAAVLLVLNAIASGKEVVVSRGELIEIGGSFRMPEIIISAGVRLREVGTTNRTHLRDYASAIGPETGALMKVHTSNYVVQGFTKDVASRDLAALAREHNVPFVDDLGSGTLIDLGPFGLSRERTVFDAVRDGADVVTFSGDKLLGGPQAGFIIGRSDLVRACATNPMKRVLRLDKVRLAALEATLRLYRDPDRLSESLPTLRYMTRPLAELQAMSRRLKHTLQNAVGDRFNVTDIEMSSQIGSGALPLEMLASAGLAITVKEAKKSGRALERLAAAFRALPIPVIGRIKDDALQFDLRTLDDEVTFTTQLDRLAAPRDMAETTL